MSEHLPGNCQANVLGRPNVAGSCGFLNSWQDKKEKKIETPHQNSLREKTVRGTYTQPFPALPQDRSAFPVAWAWGLSLWPEHGDFPCGLGMWQSSSLLRGPSVWTSVLLYSCLHGQTQQTHHDSNHSRNTVLVPRRMHLGVGREGRQGRENYSKMENSKHFSISCSSGPIRSFPDLGEHAAISQQCLPR